MSQLHAMKKQAETGGLLSFLKGKPRQAPEPITDPLKGGKGVKSQKAQIHKNTVKAMKARARGDKVRGQQ